jgi:3-hydroxybutyryl-CoA dehydratase
LPTITGKIQDLSLNQTFQNSFILKQEIIDKFLSISRDRNPLHIDKFFAQSKGFKSCIVHGNTLGHLISHLVGMTLPFQNVILISQKINYKAPMYKEDKISLIGKITTISETTNVFQIKLRFYNQNEAVIATGLCAASIL